MTEVSERSVIHKIVYRLDAAPHDPDLVQTFDVPHRAEVVAVDWDTRNELGIAVWYRVPMPPGPDYTAPWRLMVRGTGHEFISTARHLATVVRDGFAWHLLDADGDQIRWAAS